MNGIAKCLQDEEGAAAVEYGLLAALIAAVIGVERQPARSLAAARMTPAMKGRLI